MAKRTFFYLITAAVMMGGIYLFSYLYNQNHIAPLSSEAIVPDLLLKNSSVYYREHAIDRSISQLDQAIESIRKIEIDLDDESRRILDIAIEDLENVKKEIENNNTSVEHMDAAFTRVLNALTLAELRVSEALIETNHGDEARVALKYGMYHLNNTLNFTTGKKKDYELHIYRELDSLLVGGHISHKEMIDRLEVMIKELDSLIE